MTNSQSAQVLAMYISTGMLTLEDLPTKAVAPVMRAQQRLARNFTKKPRTGAKPSPRFSTMVRQWVAEAHVERIQRNPRRSAA